MSEVQALAREIATVEGIPMPEAQAKAAAHLADLAGYARSWNLAALAGRLWQQALAHAETHCWRCDGAIAGDAQDGDTCPSCGADVVPF